jgi:hypothetical protein
MNYEQFILDIYVRLYQEFELVLKDLTVKELSYQPTLQSNRVGWLAWHMIRSQDRMNADLFGEEQLWIREKWHAKFNRKPDPNDTGVGHTLQQITEFHAPDVQVYLNYYKAVFERTKEYITTRLSPSDLQREVVSLTLKATHTVETRLLGTINNFQHVGQAGYVKGMLRGIGWYGR